MRRLYTLLFAFCCVLGVQRQAMADICSANPLNLVSNCGFETGTFSSWTLSGNDVSGELNNLYGVEGVDPIDEIAPHSGNNQAYIGDLDANATTLSQTIATLVGVKYIVSFYLAQDTAPDPSDRAGYSNELIASFGATTLINQTNVPVEGYTDYSYVVTATSTTSAFSLTLGNDLGEFLLDDTSVVATPEPSAWFLLLTAGALCAFSMRQKFQKGRA